MRRLHGLLLLTSSLQAQNLADWNRILAAYYDPTHGFDYKNLKAKEAANVQAIRQQLGRVNVAALTPKQQLAHWINVYNANTVATILEVIANQPFFLTLAVMVRAEFLFEPCELACALHLVIHGTLRP